MEFCENQNYGQFCGQVNTATIKDSQYTEPSTQISNCLKPDISSENEPASKCKCFLISLQLNTLECTDPTMTQIPIDFSTDNNIEFGYVNFVGSSIKIMSKNQFKNLRLSQDATIILSGIEEFEDDVFSNGLVSSTPFRLVIMQSSLFSLYFNSPFRRATFTQLEFVNFTLQLPIQTTNFAGSMIDTLIFKSPNQNSISPFFTPQPFLEKSTIRKLKIENARDIFKKNSDNNRFGIDNGLLNNKVFAELNELEIINTNVDFIESFIFTQELNYKSLNTVRFENIGLKELITKEVSISYEEPNWLSSTRLKRVYLGHEVDSRFQFLDEYLCYFVDLNPEITIFMYDNLDSSDGISCTCTVYWIYRNFDFSILNSDPDSKYIPKCLKDKDNVQKELLSCLKNKDPVKYCKEEKIIENLTNSTTIASLTSTNSGTSVTTDNSKSSMTTSPDTTKNPDTTTTANNELKEIYNLMIALIVCVSVLILGIVAGFAMIFIFIFKLLKKTSTTVFPLNNIKNTIPV